MSRTRYEWTLLDFASWSVGLIPAPVYETSSIKQIIHVLSDVEVDLVIAKTVSMAEIACAAAGRSGHHHVIVLSLDSETIGTLIAEGADIPHTQVTTRTDALRKDGIATIIYTSGTTDAPKDTVLTHENFTGLCPNTHAWTPEVAAGRDSRLLLFLPLAHVFTRFLQVFQISGNGVLAHVPNIKNLLPDLTSFKPSYLPVVPRVLEKVYNSADAKASKDARKAVFRWAARVAIEYSKALGTAEGPSRSLRARRALADKLIYRNIAKLVGGNARCIVLGGAPLATWPGHFYRGLGIPVLKGYGPTEAVGPVSVSTPSLSETGTVGPTLPPMSSKTSDEDGILLRGPSIFHGYDNDPEAGAACSTKDGWFRTGDLSSLDRNGYVRITGRAKEIIVTAGGENVAPALLENLMRSHPLTSQILAVGDQRPFVSAIITLDAEILPVQLESHDLPPMSVADARTNVEVLTSLQEAVDSVNAHISRAESICKFTVLALDFAGANGMLTPSLKVKRDETVLHLTPIIDEFYGGLVQA